MAKRTSKFNRCVKQVRRTVKARKGSSKESAAIAICTTSILHPRGRTLKRYRRGRLTTQRKFRGGDVEGDAQQLVQRIVPQLTGVGDVKVIVPEAKGNPAVGVLITKLQAQKASKGLFTRGLQAVARGFGDKGTTANLVTMLQSLQQTGEAVVVLGEMEDEDFAAKLRGLYPMM